MKKKILSLTLALVMALTMLPLTALAVVDAIRRPEPYESPPTLGTRTLGANDVVIVYYDWQIIQDDGPSSGWRHAYVPYAYDVASKSANYTIASFESMKGFTFFTGQNKSFTGWTNSSGGNPAYFDADTFTFAGNLTWKDGDTVTSAQLNERSRVRGNMTYFPLFPVWDTPPEAPNVSAASSWARDYINEAYAGGYLPEELQKDYRDDITRGEFVRLAMSWLRHHTGMTNAQLVAGYAQFPNRSFDDTDDEELTAAGILGITNGNGQGQFLENMGFNREQAAAMLTRTYALLGFETENAPAFGWEDLSAASGWARNDMNFVGEHNIMQGTAPPAKIFSPKDPFTRQQSIITFVRIDRNID